LPHADVASDDAVQSCLDLIVANFCVVRITEKTCMNKREMPHVQKVLDYTRAMGLEEIRTRAHFSKRSIIPFGKGGTSFFGVPRHTQIRPYLSVM